MSKVKDGNEKSGIEGRGRTAGSTSCICVKASDVAKLFGEKDGYVPLNVRFSREFKLNGDPLTASSEGIKNLIEKTRNLLGMAEKKQKKEKINLTENSNNEEETKNATIA